MKAPSAAPGIRTAVPEDLPALLKVYGSARRYMRENGNATQWAGGYPQPALLQEDIALHRLYAVTGEDGQVHGGFMLLTTPDPTYAVIEGGAWRSDTPYATIHRIASDGAVRGVFNHAVAFARERHDHLRIDTFRDNHIMQKLILAAGFSYRGIIHLENGDPRLAYDWLAEA